MNIRSIKNNMRKEIFRIDSNYPVAKDIFRLRISSGEPVTARGGEFVEIALEGFYLRRPISVCDCAPEGLTLLYKKVGAGTERLAEMKEGERLDVLTGLGRGFTAEACRESALLVGGGLGAAPLHLLCRELLALGRKVSVALGFNSAQDAVLLREFEAMGVTPLLSTVDGSAGMRGSVTDLVSRERPQYDFFYTCGPLNMMRAVCLSLEGGGEASLEERMGCGAGFCCGCSVRTASGPRRVCKDGPVFRKEELLW